MDFRAWAMDIYLHDERVTASSTRTLETNFVELKSFLMNGKVFDFLYFHFQELTDFALYNLLVLFVPSYYGTRRTPYPPYPVFEKIFVLGTQFRTLRVRYSLYSVLFVPCHRKNIRTRCPIPYPWSTVLFVLRTLRTRYKEYESTVPERPFSYEGPWFKIHLTRL